MAHINQCGLLDISYTITFGMIVVMEALVANAICN
jgi:hypothetical protein